MDQLAVALTGAGPRLTREPLVRDGSPGVLVRTELMGVCRSDLKEIARVRGGPSQFGHELVGVVEDGVLPVGTRVCLDPNAPVRRGSGFARELWVSGAQEDLVRALPVAPDGVSARTLVFAEPAACAAHCVAMAERHLGGPPGRVTVLGAGVAGVLIAGLAELAGADVALRNRGRDRLDFLVERGVLPAAVGREVPPDSQDVVVVATSFVFPDLLRDALGLVRPGGVVMLYGGTKAGDRLPELDCDLDTVRRRESAWLAGWHGKPVVVGGSYGTGPADFPRAMAALAGGLVVEPLVTGEVPLTGLPAELERLTTDRVLGKVLVTP
ncbi:alcohol dehydrogenase catalytic domain-containing protein [Umezawaea sp. Da 62-37]|uniref:alcohol dehydrogenase catalytic domain-containing protein n=1 Tax=Umezawaea sp. Da 62-37 TaxID=3075927 RepID=UPI0028F73E6B|nr:alcohol dehydrogenase catalytic domain-containing protein [Umezawaea sp. Da 62-37]WNV90059.1 alcohol dehydrogenase catalytic domain-containing protein [Umezawaea sp. Da 62-37]